MNQFRPPRMAWQPCASGPNGPCVEVAYLRNGMVLVRDAKRRRRGAVLTFTPQEWRAIIKAIKTGEFDNGRAELVQVGPLGNFVLQFVRDATVDQNQHELTIDLFRFARTTCLAFAGAIIFGSACFGAALACGSYAFGTHPHIAISLGAGGGAVFMLTATLQAVRCMRALLWALSGLRRQGDPPTGSLPHQDRPAA